MDNEREIVIDLRSTTNAGKRLAFAGEFGPSESIPGMDSGCVTRLLAGSMPSADLLAWAMLPVTSWKSYFAALRRQGYDVLKATGARAREVEQLFASLAPAT